MVRDGIDPRAARRRYGRDAAQANKDVKAQRIEGGQRRVWEGLRAARHRVVRRHSARPIQKSKAL